MVVPVKKNYISKKQFFSGHAKTSVSHDPGVSNVKCSVTTPHVWQVLRDEFLPASSFPLLVLLARGKLLL